MGVVEEIRRQLGFIKERVLEKLATAAAPADAIDNARQFLENLVKDVSVAAHGLTKDALSRIKTHLVDIMPSLSPAITTKMVDDAAKEAKEEGEDEREEELDTKGNQQSHEHHQQISSRTPTASFLASLKSSSRL